MYVFSTMVITPVVHHVDDIHSRQDTLQISHDFVCVCVCFQRLSQCFKLNTN